MNAKQCPDGWYDFPPVAVTDTDKYGFVVPHPAFWGLPIPGFAIDRMPAHTDPENPDNVPCSLRITAVSAEKGEGGWTGGDLSFLATRTPPLFHAFHHKTDQGESMENGGHGGGHGGGEMEPSFRFERRAETNVIERQSFQPRDPLPGRGRNACVELFDVKFPNAGDPNVEVAQNGIICFSQFDSTRLIELAQLAGYFETRRGGWDVRRVGPLNALWIVILQAGSNNTPVEHLDGGYRLWHYLNHAGKKEGYDCKICQNSEDRANATSFKFEIELSGRFNEGDKPPRCPSESATVSFELNWD